MFADGKDDKCLQQVGREKPPVEVGVMKHHDNDYD